MNLSCHLDQKGVSVGYADPDKSSNYKLKNVKEPRIFSLIISSESPIIPEDLRTRGVQEQTGIGDA